MCNYTATYSPEDNKLRLYASSRLNSELYQKVRDAGFRWAPKQELFVAPSWSPKREDLLIELAGEIGDEDTSLVDRAEKKAERFEGYSSNRAQDADSAHAAVHEITKHIPLGQPILVGHHSEKRARRDAAKIDNGMRKAVKMWETSKYWEERAAGAVHSAKYKELPRTRARRIKKLEAEIRKYKAYYTPNPRVEPSMQTPWRYGEPDAEGKTLHVFCGNGRGGQWVEQSRLEATEKSYARAIQHNENRLIYERAMLEEQGASDLLKPKAKPKQLPICNYRAPEGINIQSRWNKGEFKIYEQVEMTKAEFKRCYDDYRGTWEADNSHRVRMVMNWDKKQKKTTFSYMGGAVGRQEYCVFLTDSKVHKKPKPIEKEAKQTPIEKRLTERMNNSTYKPPARTKFDDLKDRIKEGVQTVSAPQLFPTPPETAAYMVELAEIEPGMSVLEPSAGTGNILQAIMNNDKAETVIAVEINHSLAENLKKEYILTNVHCADFLTYNRGENGKVDRIIMNPPFKNGEDIKHIMHAIKFLKHGGILVSLCANGPRQQKTFKDIAEIWEPQNNIFKDQGTNINSAILVLKKA